MAGLDAGQKRRRLSGLFGLLKVGIRELPLGPKADGQRETKDEVPRAMWPGVQVGTNPGCRKVRRGARGRES